MENLQVGDVITSRKFARLNCTPLTSNKLLTVGAPDEIQHYVDGKVVTADLRAHDLSRGMAKFVVVRAWSGGGGYGHGPGDYYPDGWEVRAKRLNDDGTFNEDGEEVGFSQCRHFTHYLEDFKVVGKMKATFV